MTIVLDASAAYDLLTQATCASKIATAAELLAPDLLVSELLNARWKVARSGTAAPTLEITLDFLGRLRLLPTLPYASSAAALSRRLDHPVYDCIYVAAAVREGARLLTLDQRLRKKLRTPSLAKLLA